MTPRKKAKELFKKYYKGKDEHGWFLCEFESCAKQCALVAVDEILDASLYYFDEFSPYVIYWQQVKKEIWLIT